MKMSIAPLVELVDGLPNLCGAEAQVEEVTRTRQPVFLPETNLHLDRLQAVFAVALHMHQPLIPAGGGDLRHADVISNLLKPMEQLSARFHEVLDGRAIDKNSQPYRNALYHLLLSESSDFRYWGQGRWTDYGRELCRRGAEILAHDFR
jgi:hypothetical protein